jgi:hypothetical protein
MHLNGIRTFISKGRQKELNTYLTIREVEGNSITNKIRRLD